MRSHPSDSGGTGFVDSPVLPGPFPRPAAAGPGGAHARTVSGTSSLREDFLLRELDAVVEARHELDSLESLLRCPALAENPAPYAPSLRSVVPGLLCAGTAVPHFQATVAARLLGHVPYLLALAKGH